MSAAAASSNGTGLREKVSFRKGTPLEVTIQEGGNPTESQSFTGELQYRYFLQGHKIMFVPESVHQDIQRARASYDATFAVTKHTEKPWTVVHLDDEPAPPVSQPRSRGEQLLNGHQCGCGQPATIADHEGEAPRYCGPCALRRAQATLAEYDRQQADAAPPWPRPTQPPPTAAAAAQPAHRTEPTPRPAAQQSFPSDQPFSTTMYTCYCAALKVAAAVEAFGTSIGRPLAFKTEDIRAMGTSLYIDARGGK